MYIHTLYTQTHTHTHTLILTQLTFVTKVADTVTTFFSYIDI